MSGFKIRPYEAGDEEQILNLFNRVFSADNPDFTPRDMDAWRHTYERNPCGHKTLVGTDLDGNIVANYSSCPVKIHVKGEERVASQVVDSCVDIAWRRSLRKNSLFITIANEYQRTYCDISQPTFNDFIYGLPNENHYPLGVRLLGYTPVHCPLPRQVRDFDEGWSSELAARAGDVVAKEADWTQLEVVAELAARHAGDMSLGNVRDLPYLAWRYRDWPEQPYGLIIARRGGGTEGGGEGEPCGAVFFRVGVPWEKRPVVAVLDWFGSGSDEQTMAALLSKVAAVAWEREHARLETWLTPAMPHIDCLRELGLAQENTQFNLCMVLFSQDYDISWVQKNWHLTMGDTDIY